MKIQKHVSRKVENKIYYKWVLIIPPNYIKKLKWKEGEELKADLTNGKLTIKQLKDL
ncbi:MAG: hypothetical protein ABIJ92_00325 [Candidatus Aenigmatarchaeota archaeon]